MQSYTALVPKKKSTDILAQPPESGQISVYAQKLLALAFLLLCSCVVFGHEANYAFVIQHCSGLCIWHVIVGISSAFYTSALLLLNYMAESGRMSRAGCFSHGLEAQLVSVLIIPWCIVASTASLYGIGAARGLTIRFAWLAFFGSIYATFKAYHSFKEQDLPSPLPEGFDEELFVYG